MEPRENGRRILLVIPVDFEVGRGILRGIRNYIHGRSDWSFHLLPPTATRRAFKGIEVDGAIIHLQRWQTLPLALRLHCPIVNVSNTIGDSLGLPRVGSDEERIGRLAAEHYLDRGFRHFAFFGFRGVTHSRERGAAFRKRLVEAGCAYEKTWDLPAMPPSYGTSLDRAQSRVVPFLRSLPKPTAILTATPQIGFELLEVCRRENLAVPHEVAVLTVDDDEVICNLATPPLSAVRTEYERIGAEAAALLERLMAGERPPTAPILIPPDRVVVRPSTDVLAVHDPALEKALRFILAHIGQPIRGTTLAAQAGVSRRLLERKFRATFGLAPLQQVRRLRIDRARQLLAETNLPMPPIAEQCGFATPQLFANVFRRHTGHSPTAYRRLFSRHVAVIAAPGTARRPLFPRHDVEMGPR